MSPKATVNIEDGLAVEIYEAYSERKEPVIIGIIAGMRVESDRLILNLARLGKFKPEVHPMPQIQMLQDYEQEREGQSGGNE